MNNYETVNDFKRNKLTAELMEAINSSYDGIWITDGNGKTVYINKAIERITRLKSKDVIGKHMQELVDKGIFNKSATLKVLKEKKTVTIMQKVHTGIETIVTGNPRFDESGKITSVISNVRDITELNALKKQLEIIEKQNQRYHLELSNLKLKYNEMNQIIYKSKIMQTMIEKAVRVAKFDTMILLLGESGVGKEGIAQLIHDSSPRKEFGTFIRVNCSALPENLLESELFGYKGGAFTGALQQGKPGMFELANNGTILLDEIGELPLGIQAKFLRVLQESEVIRLGDTKPIKINTRIIAATNRDLKKMVKDGNFREDLYYRLNVVPLIVPPLRERKEDIPFLTHYFMNSFNKKYDLNKSLTQDIIQVFIDYPWPGNVRELKNLIERLVVTTEEDIIQTEHIPPFLFVNQTPMKEGKSLRYLLEHYEKEVISKALNLYGSTYKAAEILGVSQSTMARKAQKYGVKRS